jgi:MYXO-CTERM domain-containing protein
MRDKLNVARGLAFLATLFGASFSYAKTITITPADNYSKMEAAVAGDIIEIAPGTYSFRVDFDNAGTATNPITVRAQDPTNRPVWDLTGTAVSAAPGSYTGGDRGRGCWQFRGGYYHVDGIVFKNCTDHGSAGIRVVNVPGIEVRNSRFVGNTNGLTGAGEGLVVEFSEFDSNGKPYVSTDSAAHQMYIFGGTIAVRYSWFHDAPSGQDFHVRARDATLEYNWFTRPGSYLGDLMTCEQFCGSGAQTMLLRGNVMVQGSPANHSQLLVMYNDETSATAMAMTLVNNTIIGTAGYNNAVVHHRNDTVPTTATLLDNVVTNFKQLDLLEASTGATVSGSHNWVTTGTDTTGTSSNVSGSSPGLSASYVPQAGSPVIGAASSAGTLAPTFEYYRDETLPLEGRARATAKDIGAFESTTTSTPFDGHGSTTTPSPDLATPAPRDMSMPVPHDMAVPVPHDMAVAHDMSQLVHDLSVPVPHDMGVLVHDMSVMARDMLIPVPSTPIHGRNHDAGAPGQTKHDGGGGNLHTAELITGGCSVSQVGSEPPLFAVLLGLALLALRRKLRRS